MSRVYFHSPSGDAELLGSERAHADILARDIGCGALDAFHNHERLRELLNPQHDMARKDTSGEMITWAFWFNQSINGWDGGTPLLTYRGAPISGSDLIANTAIAVGSDPVRFMTRLSGQCEIHGYVEGPNRAWLADIIDEGLDSGVMRRSQAYQPSVNVPREEWPVRELGWSGVVDLLRARDDEPVVMSYSVTDRFPAKSWNGSMKRLRKRSETMLLEMKPDDWRTFRFGHGLTAFDLYAHAWRDRIEAALGMERQGT